MRIIFGWTLDRAPWSSGPDGSTTVVTGPLGLLGILQTRLGTTRPSVGRPIRIAQYRSLMAQANHPWYRSSFANDPWNTAHHLLNLRDDAIEAGWQPTTDDKKYAGHPRLDALARIEAQVRLGPSHDQAATLAPGRADDLREVLELLRQHGPSWPLGIEAIEVRDQVDDLPEVWRNILEATKATGVAITNVPAKTSVPMLTVTRGPDTWSTAEAAARWLANTADHENLCIIAGSDTMILDDQLARRTLPTLGIPRSTATSPSGQVLPVFLSAILPPTDVRRIAEFLTLSFGSEGSASPPKILIPRSASTELMKALSKEPGISGDPDSAWMGALRTLHDRAQDNPKAATRAWETARTVDEFVRVSPPVIEDDDLITLASLRPALDWLAARLRALTHRTNAESRATDDETLSFITEAADHVASFREALVKLAMDTISVRELFDIAEACAPSSASTSPKAQAAKWTVVSDPAEVPEGTDTVLWWSSSRSDSNEPDLWDPVETAVLAQSGARVSTAPERERLRQAATMRGIRSAATMICFCPDRIRGEQTSLHPSLARLAEDIAATRSDQFAEASVDAVLSHPGFNRPASTLYEGETWTLHDASTDINEVEREPFTPPKNVSRSLDGDFTHLLPERLSFTQIERLLSDPLAWTLERALGLQSGYSYDIPTDNRMIGTFAHAVVEQLVVEGTTLHGAAPSAEAIARTFDRLVPRFASELLLPGQKARLGAIRSTTLGSLTQLFTTLQQRGITITAAEADFTYEWNLTVADTPRSVHLGGMRDLEGEFSDGRRSIIDLKWTNSGKRFRTMIDDGEAVQLSIYAQTTAPAPVAKPLTAYFLLKQGRFVSTDSALDPDFTIGNLSGDPAGLWPRIHASVEDALSKIATGRFEALGADVYADSGIAPGEKSTTVNKAIEAIKTATIDEGRLFIITPQHYSNFNLVYGIAGDYS